MTAQQMSADPEIPARGKQEETRAARTAIPAMTAPIRDLGQILALKMRERRLKILGILEAMEETVPGQTRAVLQTASQEAAQVTGIPATRKAEAHLEPMQEAAPGQAMAALQAARQTAQETIHPPRLQKTRYPQKPRR